MKRNMIALSLSATLALAACKGGNSADANNNAAADTNSLSNSASTGGSQQARLDAAFVTDGIKGDTAELAIAQLATSKGSTQGVRDFAQMLITDHSAHKAKLVSLAKGAGLAVPTEPSDAGRAQLQKLEGLSGAAFDKALLETLIGNHKKGIAKNEAQSTSSDHQTAALARETVPILKKHLATAEGLAK